MKNPLPVGLLYDVQDHVILDPDRQVQRSLRTFFDAFERIGTALGTVKYFHQQALQFPRRLRRGVRKGELVWGPLVHSRTLQILHNPRYAGAFVHGRQRACKTKSGRNGARKLPQEERDVVIPNAHPGYITWDQYQRNQNPNTSDRQRKQMVRLLIEDVTLLRGDQITAHIRFKGGATRTLTLPIPPTAWQARLTRPEVIAEIDRLLDDYTDAQITDELNQHGFRSGTEQSFTPRIVGKLRLGYRLKSRYDRLRQRGMLTQAEIAQRLGIHTCTVRKWARQGLLKAHAYNDKNECLYEPPGQHRPIKHHGIKLSDPRRFPGNARDRTNEVQDEA